MTAYDIRISDWSSDVFSYDLKKYRADCLVRAKAARLKPVDGPMALRIEFYPPDKRRRDLDNMLASFKYGIDAVAEAMGVDDSLFEFRLCRCAPKKRGEIIVLVEAVRSEEHTSELQSLMRISYAVFCLKKKKK